MIGAASHTHMNDFVDTFRRNLKSGAAAFEKGDQSVYLHALDVTGQMLATLCQHDQVELALLLELEWYALVKKIESDEHYAQCFRHHASAMWSAGQKMSFGPVTSGDPNTIAFVAQNSVLLGHTEVMLLVMAHWRKRYPHLRLLFVGLTPCQPSLAERLNAIGVQAITPPAGGHSPLSRIHWLREVLITERARTAVWLSLPLWAPFIFGFGVCARQVFWSLKFHAVHMGPTVIHIGMTKKADGIEIIHGKPWHAFQPPLVVSIRNHDPAVINEIRTKFNDQFLFATLAREEKFNSPRFATTVAHILKRCPNSYFLFTGRSLSNILINAFKEHRVLEQSCFIGWVDTDMFSNAIDCFLESFPFGCGVTGMQALTHGSPMISLWDKDTLPTYYFQNPSLADKFKPTWQVLFNESQYEDAAVNCYMQWSNGTPIKSSTGLDTEILDEHKFEQFLKLIIESQS